MGSRGGGRLRLRSLDRGKGHRRLVGGADGAGIEAEAGQIVAPENGAGIRV